MRNTSRGFVPRSDTDPDYPALRIGNFIFGGSTLASRLGDRIRQKDGLSTGPPRRLPPRRAIRWPIYHHRQHQPGEHRQGHRRRQGGTRPLLEGRPDRKGSRRCETGVCRSPESRPHGRRRDRRAIVSNLNTGRPSLHRRPGKGDPRPHARPDRRGFPQAHRSEQAGRSFARGISTTRNEPVEKGWLNKFSAFRHDSGGPEAARGAKVGVHGIEESTAKGAFCLAAHAGGVLDLPPPL